MTLRHTQVDLLVELVGLEGFRDTCNMKLVPLLTVIRWFWLWRTLFHTQRNKTHCTKRESLYVPRMACLKQQGIG